MAMYLSLSSSIDTQSEDTLCAPSSPQQQQATSSLERELQLQLQEQEKLASTGKRKSPERELTKAFPAPKSIDPMNLLDDKYSFKRQRLEIEPIRDYPTSLPSNEESYAPTYPFLHSTPVSRPNPSTPPRSPPAHLYAPYPAAPQEEERILREEYYSQQNFIHPGPSSTGYSSYPPASSSPFLLPPFLPSSNPQSAYNGGVPNGGYAFCNPSAPPPSDLYYSRDSSRNQSYYSPPSSGASSPVHSLEEEFLADTKMSKNMKKMTTTLGQIPGLEKIRWQSILQGTRSPDVGEREIQRRVKEAETIGARLFGGDIDKLLGSILNQHLDFLVSYVANLKNGKKKHNKLRMQLSKVLQDSA